MGISRTDPSPATSSMCSGALGCWSFFKPVVLQVWSWTSILSITRKPQNSDCQPHPRPVESEPWGGVSDVCVNKLLQAVRSG